MTRGPLSDKAVGRGLWLNDPCPECRAGVGFQCLSPVGRRLLRVHPARLPKVPKPANMGTTTEWERAFAMGMETAAQLVAAEGGRGSREFSAMIRLKAARMIQELRPETTDPAEVEAE